MLVLVFLIVFTFSFFMNEIILNKLFITNFTFPSVFKQPIRFSCGFPRLNQIATVKASNHIFIPSLVDVGESSKVTQPMFPLLILKLKD